MKAYYREIRITGPGRTKPQRVFARAAAMGVDLALFRPGVDKPERLWSAANQRRMARLASTFSMDDEENEVHLR